LLQFRLLSPLLEDGQLVDHVVDRVDQHQYFSGNGIASNFLGEISVSDSSLYACVSLDKGTRRLLRAKLTNDARHFTPCVFKGENERLATKLPEKVSQQLGKTGFPATEEKTKRPTRLCNPNLKHGFKVRRLNVCGDHHHPQAR